ncbi:MAG: TonB-dependent receptor [Bacteroidales bacterium]|jgi:hypothetical protein|nr:TonB-dependent receptor [Bacteroidales bacterium]
MNKTLGTLFALLTVPLMLFAQAFTIRGKISDEKTREALNGVSILIEGKDGTGTTSSETGEYMLSLSAGNYSLIASYLGYETKSTPLVLRRDMKVDISLTPLAVGLDEVLVLAAKTDNNVSNPQTGVERFVVEDINLLPVLVGERDVLKAIQLTPGVKPASEGSSGFFVRGGSADQNLILLDNVALYNASHLMGFFSTFNSDIVRDATLYKGAMPTEYGGRLSSILNVRQRNGDPNDYHVSGGIGLITSRLNVEGPIQRGKSSFILGARRTYADAIARLSGVEEAQNAYLYFYDLNAKIDVALSDKAQLSFSGYLGNDNLTVRDLVSTYWGNRLGELRFVNQFNPAWTSTTTLGYSSYRYGFNASMGTNMAGKAFITDWCFRQDFLYRRNEGNEWKFGLESIHHQLSPGDFALSEEDGQSFALVKRFAWENSLYFRQQLRLSKKLEVVYGFRLTAFSVLGNSEFYVLDDERNVIDSVWYDKGKIVTTYVNVEPRLSAVFRLNSVSSLKAAYARTSQSMHLLSFRADGSPFDRWILSTNNIRPQLADQFSAGYFRNFNHNMYEFSIESYYKYLRRQIDYKDNANFISQNAVETELLEGVGRAYGVELLLKKNTGRLTGWIGYTLSRSEKKINGINSNRWYNAYQDRTHDVSVVGVFRLSRKWNLSAAWVFYTGNALTYPSGKYKIDGNFVSYYAERNGYRAPNYHRLDLGATLLLKNSATYTSELAFSLYNAYGRENAYMISFRENNDDPTKSTAYQYSLFRFVPSISWNFKF